MRNIKQKSKSHFSASGLLFLGLAIYMIIATVMVSGVLSGVIDAAFNDSEDAGIAAIIGLYWFPLLIPSVLLGLAYGRYLNQPYSTHQSTNIKYIISFMLLLSTVLAVIGFIAGMIHWSQSYHFLN